MPPPTSAPPVAAPRRHPVNAARRRPAPRPAPPTTPATFYLGWPRGPELRTSTVPLCVAAPTLARYRRASSIPTAGCPGWILDSGAYSHLTTRRRWAITARTYGELVYRIIEATGRRPDFVAPQDWLCEPDIRARTGLDVREHHRRTLDNYLFLCDAFPDAPWIPVLQGWHLEEYVEHAYAYAGAGVDLAARPRVGLGSVCRRQSTAEIGAIVSLFAARNYRLHGFGIKLRGLRRYGHLLASADSMAWSYHARRAGIRLDGCAHRGPCNNCFRFATRWHQHVVGELRAAAAEATP